VSVFTFKSVMSSTPEPSVSPAIELITPSVIRIFVPADNKHDISLFTILIFVPPDKAICNPVANYTICNIFIITSY
jgi:hypothetical protein